MRICTFGCLIDKNAALALLNLALIERIPENHQNGSYFLSWLSLFKPLRAWHDYLLQVPDQYVLATFHSHWYLEDQINETGEVVTLFHEYYHFLEGPSYFTHFLAFPYLSYTQWIEAHAIICQMNNIDPSTLASHFWDITTWRS